MFRVICSHKNDISKKYNYAVSVTRLFPTMLGGRKEVGIQTGEDGSAKFLEYISFGNICFGY